MSTEYPVIKITEEDLDETLQLGTNCIIQSSIFSMKSPTIGVVLSKYGTWVSRPGLKQWS